MITTPCTHCGSLECGPVRCRFSMRPQPAYAELRRRQIDAARARRYAAAMIERDRLLGWPREYQDLDVAGRPLAPGT